MLLLGPAILGLLSFFWAVSAEVTPTQEDWTTDDLGYATVWPHEYKFGLNSWAMQFKQGQYITGIETWETDHHIRGFRAHYTNGETTTIGTTDSTHKELYWDYALVSVKRCTGIADVQGKHESGLFIELTDGRTISAGKPDYTDDENTGTGNRGGLLGIAANHNVDKGWLEVISFQTLKETVASLAIHDVVFDPDVDALNRRKSNSDRFLYPQALKSLHHPNRRENGTDTVTLHDTVTVTKSKTWTKTWSNTEHFGLGAEIEAKFKIPLFASEKQTAKSDFFWEHKEEKTNTKGESSTETLSFDISTDVLPGTSVHIWAYTVQGRSDVNWTGQMTVGFGNGKSITFATGGILKDVSYSDAWAYAEDEDIATAEAAIAAGEDEIDDVGNLINARGIGRRFIA